MLGFRPWPMRVVVISDLHLGGSRSTPREPRGLPNFLKAGIAPMMSRPQRLADFLLGLARESSEEPGRELVIAGDFVDFLAVEPWASWTPDEGAAVAKLHATMDDPRFAPVFASLSEVLEAGWKLTILLGNHDLELALPAVQDALLVRLGADPHRVHFVDDGRAYRIGGLLIEHGNRYDGANANDWERLRVIASAQSRAEASPVDLRVSMGSQFVCEHVNELKRSYPFLDLIQPQDDLVALLLLAFEPGLLFDWKRIAAARKASRAQFENPHGLQPSKSYKISSTPQDRPDPELAGLFGDAYATLLNPPSQVSLSSPIRAYFQKPEEGLAYLLTHDKSVPPRQLRQIRGIFRKAMLDDDSERLDGPTGPYGEAAGRLIASGSGIEAVVMGHTHLPRTVRMGDGWYVNTGTWIDRIRVPEEALDDRGDAALVAFLRALLEDQRPPSSAHYAEARIGADGRVTGLELKKVQ